MNEINISIRTAVLDDIPRISALIEESVRQLSIGYYSEQEIDRALVRVFGVDTQLIDDRTYFVAERTDEVVGCGGWSKRSTLFGGDQAKRGSDSELNPERDAARLRAFYVAPSCARQGIGRRLAAVCEAAIVAAGFRQAELAATLPGVPLYAALGYIPVEEVNTDLGGGYVLKCIRMQKQLVGGTTMPN